MAPWVKALSECTLEARRLPCYSFMTALTFEPQVAHVSAFGCGFINRKQFSALPWGTQGGIFGKASVLSTWALPRVRCPCQPLCPCALLSMALPIHTMVGTRQPS